SARGRERGCHRSRRGDCASAAGKSSRCTRRPSWRRCCRMFKRWADTPGRSAQRARRARRPDRRCRRYWRGCSSASSNPSIRTGFSIRAAGLATANEIPMQTNLAEFIKNSPQGEEAERILRACVHCGFCLATCPTYQLLGDERDSPRGRIYQIKQVLEGQPATAAVMTHLDRCLTCRSCETTCPS